MPASGAPFPRTVVLTGAGISAESGLRTFRDAGGLWENHRVEQVATPEAFAADPDLVHRFYNERRRQLLGVEPNAAHRALARLEAALGDHLLLVTQNIDDLHERAGSRATVHMHGELLRIRCGACEAVLEYDGESSPSEPCPGCGTAGMLRPHVVWFGELPLGLNRIFAALESCDLFAAIGTSGNVYPAAGFVEVAREAGARTVEINLEPSEVNAHFDDVRIGAAGREVPRWVDELLAG
jgi:NAD-dependent deacetylase